MPDTTQLSLLVEFTRRARMAETATALQFLLVNESYRLVPYQLGCLWTQRQGVIAQSGVSTVDHTAPFSQWLGSVSKGLGSKAEPVIVTPDMLTSAQQSQWHEWLPAQALWIPVGVKTTGVAGVLFCREEPWLEPEIALLVEWVQTWACFWQSMYKPGLARKLLGDKHRESESLTTLPWWSLTRLSRSWSVRIGLLTLLILLIPIHLTVLAPAELVPKDPAVIRVPIEGVIDGFMVEPNQRVNQGDMLFALDLTSLLSKLQLAQQGTQIATAEYRQGALQALSDARSRGLLTTQEGRAIERQLEADYLSELVERAKIRSPRDGVVIFDDPSEWVGKPVMAGERIIVVATETDVEIEAWLPLSDAVPFEIGSPVKLYLNTAPFAPVQGSLRYIGMEPIERPDGSYAYRARATVTKAHDSARVGLRGTARISGDYVSLFYWIFRKPMVAVRQFLGV
jgi:hypothetical protein